MTILLPSLSKPTLVHQFAELAQRRLRIEQYVGGAVDQASDHAQLVLAAVHILDLILGEIGGGFASVTVGSSMLRSNAIGVQATGGAGLLSYGNNQVTGNATNGSFTGTAGLQ